MNDQSPMVLTTIQNDFIHKFTDAFALIGGYAAELFYILATIEIVLFALFWAMKHEEGLSLFIFKIFKLAIIFFVISEFPTLLQALINGFTSSAINMTSSKAASALFNPNHLWDYGFNAGIAMTKLAVSYGTANIAMANVYLILGFGSLLMFALIGAQIIALVTAFYLISLLALLLIPFGAFFGTRNFFERGLESVVRMGARVFSLMIVLAIAGVVWGKFDLSTISQTTALTQPLGFFIATLVFLVLAYRIPSLAVEAVGHIRGRLMDEFTHNPSISVSTPPVTTSSTALSQVAAGSDLSGGTLVTSGAGVSGGPQTVSSGANLSQSGSNAPTNVSVTGSSATQSTLGAAKGKNAKTGAEMGGISRETLSKLKSTFKQAMNESKG